MDMEVEMEDYCLSLKTLPQFSGTCWFNSILHVMLYSQGLRKVIWKKLKSVYIRYYKTDKFYKFLMFMLSNYNNIEKLEKVYRSFKDLSLKPEYLLSLFLKYYDIPLYNLFLKTRTLDTGYYTSYIGNILYAYNINYFQISYSKTNNNISLLVTDEFYKTSLYPDGNVFLDNKYNDVDILLVSYVDEPRDKRFLLFDNPKIFKDITTFKQTITINDAVYRLDCGLLTNQNKHHAIALIKCNDKPYLIDSITVTNEKIFSNRKKQRFTSKPCNPISFNWLDPNNFSSDFIIVSDDVTNCSINYKQTFVENLASVYNLDKNYPLFIYIKEKEPSSVLSTRFSKEISLTSIKSSKDMLRDLTSYSMTDLEDVITRYIYDKEFLNYTNDMKRNFSFFYKKLLKKYLDPSINNEILKREFLIAVINKFIIKGNLYKYYMFLDTFVVQNEIMQLRTLNIQELLKKLSIKMDVRDFSSINFGLLYDILFNKNKSFYDDYLKSLINDRGATILIKIIIEKKFYRNNYMPILNKIIRDFNKIPDIRSRSKSISK